MYCFVKEVPYLKSKSRTSREYSFKALLHCNTYFDVSLTIWLGGCCEVYIQSVSRASKSGIQFNKIIIYLCLKVFTSVDIRSLKTTTRSLMSFLCFRNCIVCTPITIATTTNKALCELIYIYIYSAYIKIYICIL